MSDIDVIRWGQAMEHNDLGGFVSYHDYAMLYEQIELLRKDIQRRIQIGKQNQDEIDRLRAELTALRAQEPVAWRYEDARGKFRYRDYFSGFEADYAILKPVPLYAAPVPAQVPDVICVGRARFPKAGGNAGISWYAEDTLGDTAGHRTGQPNDGELLFVLAAAQKKGEGQ